MKARFLLTNLFLLVFIFSCSLEIKGAEIPDDDLTGACATTETDGTTSCKITTKAVCITNSGTYSGDNTVCDNKEEDAKKNTTEKVDMGAPTSNNLPFDFTRDLLLNNTAGNSGANLVKNRYSSIAAVVNLVIKYLFLAGGVVFFALILISGYKLVFLGDKQKALSDVKKNLTTGVLGLLIMFAVFWIIRIIETITGLSILGTFGL